MNNFFEIGAVTSAHGIKGDISVFPTTDDPTRFEILKEVTLRNASGDKVYKIQRVWYKKQFVMLKLKGVDSMNDAELLKGSKIIISAEQALPLETDEYYIRDLYGLTVEDENGNKIGEILDVLLTGANDVYVVDTGEKKIYIPAIKKCILNVDVKNKLMTVKLLEGLLDL